jgi:hypothetical protein
MMAHGPGATSRGRLIDIKFFYASELIQDKAICLKYQSTEDMIADGLTKGLLGTKCKQWIQQIHNRFQDHQVKSAKRVKRSERKEFKMRG